MLWWVARLPSLRNRGLVGWMALGLLCSSATFAVWTSGGGLETRQFTFFIVAAVVCLSLYTQQPLGPAGRVAEPGRGRFDATRGPDAGGLLLRLVRRPARGLRRKE